jgi:sortase A
MAANNWFDKNLPRINRLLFIAIILLNLYVILYPFLPQATYKINDVITKDQSLSTPEERQSIDRSTDKLVIPSIKLDQKIWVGDNEWLVNKGVWQVPDTSTPDAGSNTVLVGHRFSYKNPAVFYHLDKVNINDPIVVVWGGKLYTYKVTETKIVNPTDVYVEDATDESILTVYTCHPLWSVKQRLVVVAKLEVVE